MSDKIFSIISRQLNNLFGLEESEQEVLYKMIPVVEEASRESLSAFDNKYYNRGIDPLNSVIYTNFLYWLSRYAFNQNRGGDKSLADKIYYLNKVLNAVELYYEIELPKHWSCEHPLGSVLGKAEYGDRFFFYQGCTVGGNPKDNGEIDYPIIGDNVKMFSNAKIIGKCNVGNNVTFAANSYCVNEDIPDNVIVFGQSPNIYTKRKNGNVLKR